MVLAPDLLERARTTAADLAEAERQVIVTRAEYHTAVRRLHLGGGSLREIADALGLSHQRIQQIVDRSGGSWWRDAWRTRRLRHDAICTWCDRPPSEVHKLVAGPNVYICDACVRAAERTLRAPGGKRGAQSRGRCSFCKKRAGGTRQVAVDDAASICGECLRLCRDIMQLDAG